MYRYRYSIVCILDTTVDAVDFPRSSELEVNERTGTSDWLAARLQPITKHLTVFFLDFFTAQVTLVASRRRPSFRASGRRGAAAPRRPTASATGRSTRATGTRSSLSPFKVECFKT